MAPQLAVSRENGMMDQSGLSLLGLPSELRRGLFAVAFCGAVSTISTAILFSYISYRLIPRRRRCRDAPQRLHDSEEQSSAFPDLSLGLPESRLCQHAYRARCDEVAPDRSTSAERSSANPFLILIYNLIFADMIQSVAFTLSFTWLQVDGIHVGTPSCWMQGWFLSMGRLAVATFLSLVSIHTYLNVVWDWMPPRWLFYCCIAGAWAFVTATNILGIVVTHNGRAEGGWYSRANAWCWINEAYSTWRLWTEYFWIFLSIGLTLGCYAFIFLSVFRRRRRAAGEAGQEASQTRAIMGASRRLTGHHPVFLIYPILYVLCTVPLAGMRTATGTGVTLSATWYCVTGSLVASHGWVNVVLWSTTIMFLPSDQLRDVGLDRFVRTPMDRRYGNMVWIQGASSESNTQLAAYEGREVSSRGRWWQRHGGARNASASISSALSTKSRALPSTASQESLRRDICATDNDAIQMVTTVVVESGTRASTCQ